MHEFSLFLNIYKRYDAKDYYSEKKAEKLRNFFLWYINTLYTTFKENY